MDANEGKKRVKASIPAARMAPEQRRDAGQLGQANTEKATRRPKSAHSREMAHPSTHAVNRRAGPLNRYCQLEARSTLTVLLWNRKRKEEKTACVTEQRERRSWSLSASSDLFFFTFDRYSVSQSRAPMRCARRPARRGYSAVCENPEWK